MSEFPLLNLTEKGKASTAHSERYVFKKSHGLCVRCGNPNDRLDKTLCSKCAPIHTVISSKSKRSRKLRDPLFHKKMLDKTQIALKKYRDKLKRKLINYYGGECACCGEKEPLFLTIDHVNNDGAKERKETIAYGTSFYKRLLSEPVSDRYQLLCRNCNWGKHVNSGICPHKTK